MRPTLDRTWSSCKSVITRSREVSFNDSGLSHGMFSISERKTRPLRTIVYFWRKAPGAQDAPCEAVLKEYASLETAAVLSHLQTSLDGLSDAEAARRLKLVGPNVLSSKKPLTKLHLILLALHNPFNYMLALIAITTAVVPPPGWPTFGVIVAMVVISCVVRYWQELRSTVAAIQLQAGLLTEIHVRRQCDGHGPETSAFDEKELVTGDIVLLSPGDSIPADCLIIESSNLSVGQSRYAPRYNPSPWQIDANSK